MLCRFTVAFVLSGSAVVWGANPSQIAATPATVTFRSADPDAGPVPAASTVTWVVAGGKKNYTWSVTARASSSSLGNCGTVPTSAIVARCTSVTVSGGGSGACAQAIPLGISDQQIASGYQGQQTADYTVNITYQFTDSWKYKGAIAPTCSLTLTYVVNVQ